MELAGKTAVVIGGGAGIGREIVLGLARAGVSVLIGDLDEGAAVATARAASIVCQAEAVHCDLGDDASVDALAQAAFTQLGRVDLLFNHAGASLGGVLEQVTSDDWLWLLNLNLIGLGRSIRAFLPRMTDQGGGWIVNTSSGLGLFHDMPAAAPYIATKAAIIAYSRALSTYASTRKIGVSVFCPDITATGFLTAGRLVGIPPVIAAMGMPSNRIQRADEAASALLQGLADERFLISLVPNTAARLASMAAGDLAPGADDDRADQPIIQRGSVRVPDAKRAELAELCGVYGPKFRSHPGCIAYETGASLEDPNLLTVFEVWRDRNSLDAHAFAPESLAFIARLVELGVSDLSVEALPNAPATRPSDVQTV